MPRLSDLQLASMLEEIAAAMRVNTPIADAMQRLGGRRLGSVANTARQIADRLERGESIADAIHCVRNPMLDQASAAIASCEKSGDPNLLSHVATQLRTRFEYGRMSRITWLYPIMLMVIAYVVAITVMAPVVRFNQGRDFQWDPWVVGLSNWLEANWIVPPIVAAGMLIALLVWLITRKRMPKHVRQQLFFQSLADQFQHDVPEDEAIRNAALMSGDVQLCNETQLTLQTPAIAARLSAVDTPYAALAGTGLDNKETMIARFRFASGFHHERARKHAYYWSRLAPRIAMVAAGGGMTIAYAWWVIRPVYQQVAHW